MRRSGIRSFVEVNPQDIHFASGYRSEHNATLRAAASTNVVGSEHDPSVGIASTNLLEAERGAPEIHGGLDGLGWPAASMLIVADVVGTGVLAIPGAMRSMGWYIGVPLILICFPLNLYVGLLLERLRRWVAPGAATLGDLAFAILGRFGGLFGWLGLYTYILFTLGDYVIVISTSLQGLVNSETDVVLDKQLAVLVTAIFLSFPNQLRTLSNCVALCISSAVTMALALAFSIGHIASNGECAAPKSGVSEALTFWAVMRAMSSFTFAFAGSTIFLEMMAEMSKPSDFRKSLYAALPSLLAVYCFVGFIVFGICGDNTPGYLLDALPDGAWVKRVVSALLFLHTLTCYVINQQVLSRGVHLFLSPKRASVLHRREEGFWIATLEWFLITTAALGIAVFLALVIPDFEDIVSLIGSLFATPLSFLLPFGCLLGTLRMADLKMPGRVPEGIVNVFLFIFAIFLTTTGTISVIKQMVAND
jgi:amino acid permease